MNSEPANDNVPNDVSLASKACHEISHDDNDRILCYDNNESDDVLPTTEKYRWVT